MKFRFIFALFTCLISINVLSSGSSGTAKITSIYALNENAAIIKLSSFTNPDNCKIQDTGDVFVNPTTEKTWFTLLLSAYMAGKDVDIYVNSECRPYWADTSFATIGHVRVLN